MRSDREIENARISHTTLGVEDHGILILNLGLDYGGSGQGAGGGWSLDGYNKATEKREGVDISIIRAILETLEVSNWEALPGTFLRADHDRGEVYAIGHPLKDKWFNFQEWFDNHKEVK